MATIFKGFIELLLSRPVYRFGLEQRRLRSLRVEHLTPSNGSGFSCERPPL